MILAVLVPALTLGNRQDCDDEGTLFSLTTLNVTYVPSLVHH